MFAGSNPQSNAEQSEPEEAKHLPMAVHDALHASGKGRHAQDCLSLFTRGPRHLCLTLPLYPTYVRVINLRYTTNVPKVSTVESLMYARINSMRCCADNASQILLAADFEPDHRTHCCDTGVIPRDKSFEISASALPAGLVVVNDCAERSEPCITRKPFRRESLRFSSDLRKNQCTLG